MCCSDPSLTLFVLGNRALVLLPHNHRRTCHLKSLLHPLLNPLALARGGPFTNGEDSDARVRNRRAGQDPSSKHRKCNHHLGRLTTVPKLLAPGQLGKVSFLRQFFFLSLKVYTRQQYNLVLSTRRHQVNLRFI